MRTVALYGDSVALSSIGASLERHAGVKLVTIRAELPGAAERLRMLGPDVVICDSADCDPDVALGLWKAHPHLLLIGVDVGTGRALVLSGQPSRVLTLEDLLHVIEGPAAAEAESPQQPVRASRQPKQHRS